MLKKRECPICSNCGSKKFKVIENNTTGGSINVQCLQCLKIALI